MISSCLPDDSVFVLRNRLFADITEHLCRAYISNPDTYGAAFGVTQQVVRDGRTVYHELRVTNGASKDKTLVVIVRQSLDPRQCETRHQVETKKINGEVTEKLEAFVLSVTNAEGWPLIPNVGETDVSVDTLVKSTDDAEVVTRGYYEAVRSEIFDAIERVFATR